MSVLPCLKETLLALDVKPSSKLCGGAVCLCTSSAFHTSTKHAFCCDPLVATCMFICEIRFWISA